MKKFTVNTIALFIFFALTAQEDNSKIMPGKNGNPFRIYLTWISLNNDPIPFKGVLYEINDSSIMVSNSKVREDYYTGRYELSKIDFNNIDIVKTRMKNNVARVALIGAVAGFTAGGLIGLISGDDPSGFLSFSAEEKALLFGGSMAVGGAGIGALEGLVQIKIPINGSMENFKRNKSKLKKYTIR